MTYGSSFEDKTTPLKKEIIDRLSKKFGGTWRFMTNVDKKEKTEHLERYRKSHGSDNVQCVNEAYWMNGHRDRNMVAIYVRDSEP